MINVLPAGHHSGHHFNVSFFPGFSNKRLFQEAFKIICFISFPYHVGLVYTQADMRSIKCVLVLSLLIDWSFLLALKSCLYKENYCWWVVSNICSWADNEHNLSANVNQDKPPSTPCRNCVWNTVKMRDFSVQALLFNCGCLRIVCFSYDCLLSVSSHAVREMQWCPKPLGLSSTANTTLRAGAGGDIPGSAGRLPMADKNCVPLRLHVDFSGDAFAKVALAALVCMSQKK